MLIAPRIQTEHAHARAIVQRRVLVDRFALKLRDLDVDLDRFAWFILLERRRSSGLDSGYIISKLNIISLNISLLSVSTMPKGLDPHHSAIYLGRRFFQIAHAAAAEAHAAIGLSPLEFGALMQLHDRPAVDQNTLAERLALDRTTTSAIVYRLEQQGLIERAVSQSDRRARVLRLAPAGLALHDAHRPKAQAAQQRVLSVLTAAERKQLATLLTRVIDANQQYVQPGTIRRRRPKAEAAATR